MDFRDKNGAPLIKWTDAEGAFRAWAKCSGGRPCNYSRMTYAELSAVSGIQWPCNNRFPEGAERFYADGLFNTSAETCGDYGHDLIISAALPPEEYKANDPEGRAFLNPGEYHAPFEESDAVYPLWLTTGRLVYHFHTRTKTAPSRP